MLVLAVASPSPAPAAGATTAASTTRCLDAYLPLGAPLVPPSALTDTRTHVAASRIVRIALLIAPKLPKAPLVGFIYITSANDVWFGTQTRAHADPAVAPIVREIFAASSTATPAQLQRMLRMQDGNAILYVAQPLRLFRRLGLASLPCVGAKPAP